MKLLKEMGVKPVEESISREKLSFLGDWFAHIFFLNRKKNVFFCNQRSSYCVVVLDVNREKLRSLGAMFVCSVERSLKEAGYTTSEIEKATQGMDRLDYGRTNDRSTVGIMNDHIKAIKFMQDYDSWDLSDPKDIEVHLNEVPLLTKEYFCGRDGMSGLLGREKPDTKVNKPAGEAGEIHGYFRDDGTEVKPQFLPKPGLCLQCKHDSDRKQEELCNLTRIGQDVNEPFRCDAFEKK